MKKERVIILKKVKFGESDLVLHALNRNGAKLGFIAKGGLKSKKRFAGGILEPTHYVEMQYKERPDVVGDPLHLLLEAQLLEGFEDLRTNYDRLQVALYFLKVMDRVSPEGAVDSREMFDLLGNALRAAETTPAPEKLKLHFEIKVLGHQGVIPALPFAREWAQLPLARHSEIELERADWQRLEWDVHHSLEAYLDGRVD